jgi:hypothetical protein
MPVDFNHTIVWAHDSEASATFLADILGLPAPKKWGPFQIVATGNGVSVDGQNLLGIPNDSRHSECALVWPSARITSRVIVTDIIYHISRRYCPCPTTAHILGILPYHLSKVATRFIWFGCGTSWRLIRSCILSIIVILLLTDKPVNGVDSRRPTRGTLIEVPACSSGRVLGNGRKR